MSRERHAYIKFYPSDWIAGTARLSRLQRGVLLDVCLYNWDKGKPMPRVEQDLVFTDAEAQEAIETLVKLGKLTRSKGGGLASDRAVIEARSASVRSEIAKAAGKEGAKKRWKTGKNDRVAITTPLGFDSYPEPEPEPEPENPHSPQGGESDLFDDEPPDGGNAMGEKYPAAFENFWAQYPNKTGKRKAAAAYEAAFKRIGGAKHGNAGHGFLLASAGAQAVVWRRKGVEGRYIPHPATWLNQSRYDDPAVAKERVRLAEAPATLTLVEPELSPASPAPKRDRPLALAPVGWKPDDES